MNIKYKIALFILTCLISFQLKAADLKAFEQDLSDSMITAKITTKYAESKLLNPLKISVSTEQGAVTLKGFVSSKKALIEALKIAKNTHGVKRIDSDELDIKQVNMALTDAYITAKVEAVILKAKILDDESIPLIGINATTDNGTVTLTGDVKREESISFIIKRASNVHGVKKIISHLKVSKVQS
ncbi:BON domain-containing protein [Legionella israelensis]|uniref:BON domain-containing protein n=1 Tax=Legionella israelensis TaxID=454 RepID=A0AAX1ED75_9GAMM|nr:BON domain-containing protein [Legionella israelensis]QBR83071.1 BON domain-containing protein [Legionella israelensis]